MGINLRELGEGKRQATFRVYLHGEELEFYGELPSTEERVQYRRELARCFNRRGEPDLEKISRLQIKWAKRKLTGFREGDLMDGDRALSPQDENWKDLVEQYAPEVLEAIAGQMFGTVEDVEKSA